MAALPKATRSYRIRWTRVPMNAMATMEAANKADEDWMNAQAADNYRLIRAEAVGDTMCFVMERVE